MQQGLERVVLGIPHPAPEPIGHPPSVAIRAALPTPGDRIPCQVRPFDTCPIHFLALLTIRLELLTMFFRTLGVLEHPAQYRELQTCLYFYLPSLSLLPDPVSVSPALGRIILSILLPG